MSALGFAAPWMLALAGAALIPLIAHLARQEDRQGTGFPSLMFLERVPFPSRARRRVQDRALLALRLLALLALVAAFAGPHLTGAAGAESRVERDTVVLVDVSYSMGVKGRIQRARDEALAVLGAAGARERVAVMAFDQTARVLSALAQERETARQAVAGLQPGHLGTDLAAALDAASRLLSGGDAPSRRVVVVSDLQAVGLGAAPRLERDVNLELRAVGGSVAANLTLADAWLEPGDGDRSLLRVRVVNTGGGASSSSLRVSVDGLEAGQRQLTLPAGASEDLSVPVFPSPSAPTRIALMLDDDDLAADNQRHLIAAPRRSLGVLLSAGSGTPYLEAALALAREPVTSARRVAPDALLAALDDTVDVVILDAPVAGADTAARLRERVSGGMGLLAFAGVLERGAGQDPEPLRDLLPGRLDAVADAPPDGIALTASLSSHALGAALGGADVAVGPVWRRALLSAGPAERVIARFEDGAPALLERSVGAGRSVLLATRPVPRWSALALRPEFVPLVLEAVRTLSGVRALPATHVPGSVLDPVVLADAMAGVEAFRQALSRGAPMRVRRPSGILERGVAAGPVAFHEPGFHLLQAGTSGALPVAVSVVTGESRLDTLPAPEFVARIARPVAPVRVDAEATGVGAGDAGAGDDALARALLIAGGLLLLAEGAFGAWTARRRSPREAAA